MKSVQSHLFEATDTVDHLYSRTEEHIENARLAEQVIQYGNRYRGQHPQLRADLDKAEKAFRNYEYRSSLEQAAAAVEKVEPGALKKSKRCLTKKSMCENDSLGKRVLRMKCSFLGTGPTLKW